MTISTLRDADDDDSLELHPHRAATSEQMPDKNSIVTSDASTPPPLLAAVSQGSFALVQSLLQNGADVNFNDPNEEMPFVNALQYASQSGHTKVVNLLLDSGADVNAQGGIYGKTLYK
jgi:ankyrin repeat protein